MIREGEDSKAGSACRRVKGMDLGEAASCRKRKRTTGLPARLPPPAPLKCRAPGKADNACTACLQASFQSLICHVSPQSAQMYLYRLYIA